MSQSSNSDRWNRTAWDCFGEPHNRTTIEKISDAIQEGFEEGRRQGILECIEKAGAVRDLLGEMQYRKHDAHGAQDVIDHLEALLKAEDEWICPTCGEPSHTERKAP